MKIFTKLSDVPEDARGAVVLIGNFDGVHRGHCALIAKGREIADAAGLALAVLTFEPHPRRLFRPDEPPGRITPAALKAEKLAAQGVDLLYSLTFDWAFASQSAEDFIRHILIDGLGAAHIVVGADFCFGQLRRGTPEMIREAGLAVSTIEKVAGGDRVPLSSSAVRQALRHGDIAAANEALGWDWEVRGEIVKGDQRGRELGFPTANVPLGESVHPAYGVYATWARLAGEEIWRPSATNIGIRPMFEIPTAQVETHLFDFDGDVYGQILRIRPVRRLRGEAKFSSVDDLIVQMRRDCEEARMLLA